MGNEFNYEEALKNLENYERELQKYKSKPLKANGRVVLNTLLDKLYDNKMVPYDQIEWKAYLSRLQKCRNKCSDMLGVSLGSIIEAS